MHTRTISRQLRPSQSQDRQRSAGWDGHTAGLADTAPDAEDAERHLCHDLRGHLATIGLLAEAAGRDPQMSVQAARHLDSLLEEVAAARDLVQRTLSRQRHVDAVDVAVVLAQATRSARWDGGARLMVSTSSAMVAVDRVELRRVIDNLLENAMRAAGPRGVVRVRTRHRNVGGAAGTGEVVLVVEDSGPGFDGVMPSRPGGLGLRIVANLVSRMDGRLVLGSSWRGGAHVEVVLPVP